ncbi:MAG: shikimate kinase [Bacteroidales bacterium]
MRMVLSSSRLILGMNNFAKPIFLVGFMGSGKTTLGLGLAKALGFEFVDLDKFIENRNFKSVPQIFEQYGEDGFRDRERKALEEVCEFNNVVVATGGGAPCFKGNMELMNSKGLSIFLDIPLPELTKRLSKSKSSRPLIRGLDKDELLHYIENKLTERRPFYEQSKIVVEGSNITVEELVGILDRG